MKKDNIESEPKIGIVSKFQPLFILLAASVGVLLGLNSLIAANSAQWIEVFLMIMLFFVFMSVDMREIKRSFSNVKFSAAALIINFIWTPVFAYLLGRLFLAGSTDLQIGFLMLMVTPCTDWYLIFTGLAKGNVPLGSSILPLNLILQVLLLPLYLLIFTGNTVSFAPLQMIHSIVLVLVVPLLVANAVKFTVSKVKSADFRANFESTLDKHGDNIQLFLLCLAIIAMFASQGESLLENPMLFVRLFPPLIVFFAIAFILALVVGKRLGLPFKDRISLLFTTSARNSPISLTIAVLAFPERSLILLALVIGPLIELPVLAIDASILKKITPKEQR
ncbi:MAG: bile acid:sodium symporter [Clostridiales bacterium]|jgi:ACR3 family arsenite efflux pump ArsB|nr:bile acid:sodium symporter [Clostridiales bacterium]